MKEVSRREKQAGIMPEPDIDTYMKVNIPFLFFLFFLDYIKGLLPQT